jgi:ribonucleoside-triphosphate reductase
MVNDTKALRGLIKKVANNYRLPYFTITPNFSVCPTHGYLKGEQETCSVCDQETEIYSRVVGYLRPVKQWNDGKQAEFDMRKTFNVNQDRINERAGTKGNPERDADVIDETPCDFEERVKEMRA